MCLCILGAFVVVAVGVGMSIAPTTTACQTLAAALQFSLLCSLGWVMVSLAWLYQRLVVDPSAGTDPSTAQAGILMAVVCSIFEQESMLEVSPVRSLLRFSHLSLYSRLAPYILREKLLHILYVRLR